MKKGDIMFTTKKVAKKFKFEPYEDCPCESGQKYKFCCYEKGKLYNKKELNYTPGRIIFESQKIFRETDFETCFAFNKDECTKDIIGAHSLQNNGVLDKISIDNHIYYLTPVIKNNVPSLKFEKVGKNQASKFTGFCKNHDKSYFSCIEDADYVKSDEQNFWFAFRAFCFEFHRKKRLKKHYSKLFKKFPHATRDLQIQLNYRACELDLKDKELEYRRFQKIYEDRSYNKMESFIKVLPYRVGFTGTTAVAVNVDIEGEKTVDIYDYDEKLFVPSLYISVIPKETSSIIIVSRHIDDTCYEALIDKLKRNTNLDVMLKYITFCLAEFSENVYFCPALIDKLSNSEKDNIVSAFISSLSVTPELRFRSLIKGFRLNLFDLKMDEN